MSVLIKGSDTDEIMAKRSIQFRHVSVRASDIEERNKDASKAEPKGPIRAESQGTEGVARRKFPHSRAELGETSVSKS